MINSSADIVIIGRGISGVSFGYFLLKNGAKNVVILERDFLAAGATGRCGAGIRQQWRSPLNCIMTKFSCEFFETASDEFAAQRSINMEFHQGGYMLLVSTENELAQKKENIALQNSLGINSKLLSPSEARELAPIVDTDGLLAAAFYHKDGHLNPFHTTQAFADAFTQLGGIIHTNTSVTDILREGDKISGICTDKGNISTDMIVIAAGGYSQQITTMVGYELPPYSERHNILVTEPVERILEPMLMSFSLNFY